MIADMDFETYSEAGYQWVEKGKKWISSAGEGAPASGLKLVGACAYAEHPSTEVLRLAYDLKDGAGPRLWMPGMDRPTELFNFLATGTLIEAWNCSFEFFIWKYVCEQRMGWPALPHHQLRDGMAKAMAHSMPGGLKDCAKALGVTQKLEEGKRLINKYCKPRKPTKKDPRKRIFANENTTDADLFSAYCVQDIVSEAAASNSMPELSKEETDLFVLDLKINTVGCHIDDVGLACTAKVVRGLIEKYTHELATVTGGAVEKVTQTARMVTWLQENGIATVSVDEDNVLRMLALEEVQGPQRRALEIRQLIGSAAVKKLFAIQNRLSNDGRLRGMFAFCGASRTGRFSGRGPQPQNLPNSGPKVAACLNCGHHQGTKLEFCGACGSTSLKKKKWCVEAVDSALSLADSQGLEGLEVEYPDVMGAMAGCLRGLFIAAPGYDFLSSDYKAIEAVVLAMLSGEQWRIDVFRTHGNIYEMSASKITGVPYQEFLDHKARTGEDHPLRKTIGKVAELASGYQGGPGAWCNFGADKHLSKDEIKEAIDAWRKESPMICDLWKKSQAAAHNAVKNPGTGFKVRMVEWKMLGDVLHCRLPSGRLLSYHSPRLAMGKWPDGGPLVKLTYMGMHSLSKQWRRMDTYGGKLVENITQAVARDILTNAMVKLDKAGYSIALHIHDEVVCEVPEGTRDILELEAIMGDMPAWAHDWPISAAGGWRGKRYRKG